MLVFKPDPLALAQAPVIIIGSNVLNAHQVPGMVWILPYVVFNPLNNMARWYHYPHVCIRNPGAERLSNLP